MKDFSLNRIQISEEGFSILENIYTVQEVDGITKAIEDADVSNENFRKSAGLFAIRQFLKEVPIAKMVFNENLKAVVREIFGQKYFLVKSIYFDKPEESNWFVAFHQDLSISVDKKMEMKDYGAWTNKKNQFSVQPPVHILENIFTIRIHLDDTDEYNAALKVIPGSHLNGICRSPDLAGERTCSVKAGGIMIMKPLLFHSSARSTQNKKRRVIHLEFCGVELPHEIQWAEKIELPFLQ
ncbi:MAG: phytanoyl-CoA dioxygenase family protein [Bacteroidota bacterium]|nr:phytanoyl-CoA dioxygenase family protein [Bacteroidota bacterium]